MKRRRVALSVGVTASAILASAVLTSELCAEPRAVIAPVPPQWIVARGRHWLRTWRSLTDDAENAAFMVLTACRIWHFAVTHTHCSKARAAGWALDRNPALQAIRQATRNAPIAAGAIAEVLDTVLHETDRSDSGEEP